jgi:hypothetical protein
MTALGVLQLSGPCRGIALSAGQLQFWAVIIDQFETCVEAYHTYDGEHQKAGRRRAKRSLQGRRERNMGGRCKSSCLVWVEVEVDLSHV